MGGKRVPENLCCPACRTPLGVAGAQDALACAGCAARFPVLRGVPIFCDAEIDHSAETAFQQEQMFNSTLTGRLYNLGKRVISSDYMPKAHLELFLDAIPAGSVVAELGSGNRRLREGVVNVDLFPFPNVDVVADIARTPFAEASLDYVVLDAVLEHVPEPQRVVDEIFRILKPGGKVYCLAPFVYPYHGYPYNYYNFSKDGLEFLFRNFSLCRVEVARGPSSAITNLLSEYLAVALSRNNFTLYTFFKGVALAPLFLFKYLDRFWDSAGPGVRIANALCAVVTK